MSSDTIAALNALHLALSNAVKELDEDIRLHVKDGQDLPELPPARDLRGFLATVSEVVATELSKAEEEGRP